MGQTTVSGLVSMSELIAEHIRPIPPITAVDPQKSRRVEKSNASHKYFIDALSGTFKAIGGEAWKSRQKADSDGAEDDEHEADAGDLSDEASEAGGQFTAATPQRLKQNKPSGKGRKQKGKEEAKGKQQRQPSPANESSLDDVPLESYRIIKSGGGEPVTDYLMAVYDLVSEWASLRSYLQSLWSEMAYQGFNRPSPAVMKTMTRGDPDKAQGMFSLSLFSVSPGWDQKKMVEEVAIEVREQFLIYAYEDLRDFVADFQKTHSGKPTKRMLAEIANWDPNFNLQNASEKERIKWRRSYTINWLCDLVNVFLTIVGPWNVHRRLFGLNEFAGTEIQLNFIDWLGESKYQHGLTTIPPSRFSNRNPNGLWEYSPFLCGVGLMEGVELAYLVGIMIWDKIPNAILLVHLHNMFVQKGYIKKLVGLYASLQDIFKDSFFADGVIPTANFGEALLARVGKAKLRGTEAQRRHVARSVKDMHGLLSVDLNLFFKTKSYALHFRAADWDPERISETDIPVASLLALVRMAQTKRLDDTDLVRRARASGMPGELLLDVSSALVTNLKGGRDEMPTPIPDILQDAVPEGYRTQWGADLKNRPGGKSQSGGDRDAAAVSPRDMLELLKWDIFRDVCGDMPVMSLNFIWVTVRFMMLFMQIEEELAKRANPLWARAYELDPLWSRDKRVVLAFLALSEQDDECLRTMAREFEKPRAGFMNHIYWEDLGDTADRMNMDNQLPEDKCVVM
ncbi:hypothetical protein QBC33DRAFT_599685 [Phialemonium atrogriseum]|uniref:DUF6604 domain-containing protein n=1 Tax=Phialemonium atrogriseum TaxID=1093897 RepID=A0AAJ0BSY1_9PEZI|nr:uncharacterized protein QBC33DRAFT_599685 [Phialemonium atrogriseum]KAK1762813.1 hypothetical protein QBC33DRAFT_599685 [Phialemonium atrogriseum]